MWFLLGTELKAYRLFHSKHLLFPLINTIWSILFGPEISTCCNQAFFCPRASVSLVPQSGPFPLWTAYCLSSLKPPLNVISSEKPISIMWSQTVLVFCTFFLYHSLLPAIIFICLVIGDMVWVVPPENLYVEALPFGMLNVDWEVTEFKWGLKSGALIQ